MKLFFLLLIIVCISNFNFIHAAPAEMVFKVVMPDNVDVEVFNIGGKMKSDYKPSETTEATTTTTTAESSTTTTGKVLPPVLNKAKNLNVEAEEE